MVSKSVVHQLIFYRLIAAAHAATTFTDDNGLTHKIPNGAKVLCGAMDAVTLFHFGMEASQIEGTFGERSSSGSNYGGKYFDGNLADHGDHAAADYNPEHFPADPSESERAFLNMIPDFSPCSNSNYYCSEIDIPAINAAGWPDFVVFGSFYSSLLSDDFRGNATEAGVPIIELTDAYGSDAGAEKLPQGMIEITERWEELAKTLLPPEDVEATVKSDKEAFCREAEKFKATTKLVQDRGVRAMAGYLPYSGTGPNGEIGAFLASPERDTVLAMLEELGMPIIHNDAEPSRAYEYKVDSSFTIGALPFENIMSNGENGDAVPYHVDFWLYDDRVTLDFISQSFAEAWPHKAVVNKQYAYFPANARIYSYRHATEILNVIGQSLKNAEKLELATTQCTPPAEGGYAGPAHRSAGMDPGQYACHEPISYDICNPDSDDVSSSPVHSKSQVLFFTMLLASFAFV